MTTEDNEQQPMKKKRVADRQMTKDDGVNVGDDDKDDDSDNGSGGGPVKHGIPKATDDVLKARRIIKVARTADGGVDFSKKKANPFSGIQLATTTTTTSSEPASSATTPKPFIFGSSTGFSGFGAVTAAAAAGSTGFGAASGGFASGATTTTTTTTAAAGSGGFGSAAAGSGFGAFGAAAAAAGSKPMLSFGTAKGFGSVTAAADKPATNGEEKHATDEKGDEADDEKEKADTEEKGEGPDSPARPATSIQFSFATSTTSVTSSQPTKSLGGAADSAANSSFPSDYHLESGEEHEQILLECRCKSYRWTKEAPPPTTSSTSVAAGGGSAAVAGSGDDSLLPAVPPSQSSFKTTTASDPTAGTNDAYGAGNEEFKWLEVGIGPMKLLKRKTTTTTQPQTDEEHQSSSEQQQQKEQQSSSSDNKEQQQDDDNKQNGTSTTTATQEPSISKQQQNTEKSNSYRFVQRRESSRNGPATKLLWNLPLWNETQWSQPSEKHVRLSCVAISSDATAKATAADDGEQTIHNNGPAIILLLKFKTAAEATALCDLLEQEIPHAKSCVATTKDTATPTKE